jgi:hypothetical protein
VSIHHPQTSCEALPEIIVASETTRAEDHLASPDNGVDLGLRDLDDRVHVRLEALFNLVPI